ncbi:MAG: hypothetical protein ACJ8C4_13350 [Gemmataceae bacterium]
MQKKESRVENIFSTQSTDSFKGLNLRLISQLDSLVAFLSLAHHEVYEVVSENYATWYRDERQSTRPRGFQEYSQQVAHSAFLLGYSYAEAFICDVIRLVYSCRRDLLPSDKTLRFDELLPLREYEDVVQKMIDRTVSRLNSLEEKTEHLNKGLSLGISEPAQLSDAHTARNALVHNAGRVNRTPSHESHWRAGDTVRLSVDDVHDFGTAVRAFAEDLCIRAQKMCVHVPK